MKLTLYNYFRSSASYRVRIGLALKGLAYEYVAIHLLKDGGEQNRAEYKAAKNPMGQVPVLEIAEDGNVTRLIQSVAILEYLDERFATPPLLPKDTLGRARVRAIVEIINSGMQPLHNLGVMAEIRRLGGDDKLFAKGAIDKGLAALEAEAKAFGGQFFAGGDVTLADVFLIPQLYGARRFGADLTICPTLCEIEARLLVLPAVAAAHPERQPDYVA